MPAINTYFRAMVEKQASDFHLSSGAKPMFRISGSMVPIGSEVFNAEQVMSLIREIMPDHNRQQWEESSDTDFAHQLDTGERLRCNVFIDRNGPGAVFRLISATIMSFEQLGLPDSVKKLCMHTKGFVLVTGPTGSGKSTTLATMIDYINQARPNHIITIEDPIEFVHKNKRCLINQREVPKHTENWKRALRAALREDPDIVMVGEMRDLETVRIALETAETGHVVFGTLHTSTAHGTIDRLINQFPSDEQAQVRVSLAEGLKGVVAQALCRRKGGGRVAALEILMGSYALSANIREGKLSQIPSFIQMGRKEGMCSLNDSLLDLLQRDVIEATEAYQKAVFKDELIKRMAAIPHLKSPRGSAWTEEDLVRESANEEMVEKPKPGSHGGPGWRPTIPTQDDLLNHPVT